MPLPSKERYCLMAKLSSAAKWKKCGNNPYPVGVLSLASYFIQEAFGHTKYQDKICCSSPQPHSCFPQSYLKKFSPIILL